uniref:Ubiquitinyl hydrolase 1 n=1 Tax=Paramoeba aestuarina TaxID=180227 RepID=A0A7S4JWN8_9EUKA
MAVEEVGFFKLSTNNHYPQPHIFTCLAHAIPDVCASFQSDKQYTALFKTLLQRENGGGEINISTGEYSDLNQDGDGPEFLNLFLEQYLPKEKEDELASVCTNFIVPPNPELHPDRKGSSRPEKLFSLDLSIQKDKAQTLETCVNKWRETELLEGNNSYMYSNGERGDALKGVKMTKLGKSLFSCLFRRYNFDFETFQLKYDGTHVKFPFSFLAQDVFPDLCAEDQDTTLNLVAILTYRPGKGYGCAVYWHGDWWKIDKSNTVKVENAETLVSSDAYMLFYSPDRTPLIKG